MQAGQIDKNSCTNVPRPEISFRFRSRSVLHSVPRFRISLMKVNRYEDDVQQGTGAEWVKYACSRWLHDECINSVDYNSCGLEIFCSHCLD